MKRILAVSIITVLLIGLFPAIAIPVSAEVTSGTTGDCTWTLDGTVLTISGNGAMEDCAVFWGPTNEGYEWSYPRLPWGTNITEVIIGEGVTNIGDFAFHECSSLNSITIPDSVTRIGDAVFSGCSALNSLTIPDDVSVGISAFSRTGYYEDASHWDGDLLYLGNTLIDARPTLSGDYKIKEGTKYIADGAFSYDKDLISVTIPDSIVEIGRYAFYKCNSLSEVNYTGKKSDRNQIIIISDNDPLRKATWIYARCINHVYTNTCDVECNECDEKREITHTYSNACDAECNVCHEIRNVGPHKYDHSCDTTCNICGAIRLITHSFGAYVYNNDATTTKDGTKTRICSVCKLVETYVASGTMLKNPFTDVAKGQYYTDPVLWAVGKQITTGTSATTFEPDAACTRGQIVTFLWRAAGSPEPQSSRNPFADVPSDQYYYKAVLWAVEKGITTGMDSTHFAPDAPCTRGQIVTFLWRAYK